MGVALLILLLGAGGVLLAVRIYLRHEVEVRGKRVLLGIRVAVLLLALLLVLDVTIGGTDPARAAPAGGTWVLLDADLSLLAVASAAPLWDEALERVRAEVGRGARSALAVPGIVGVEGVDLPALEARGPSHPPGDLVEGITRLAEAGADSIVVVSSFRRPPGFLERMSAAAPAPLYLVPVGAEGARNAGVLEISIPAFVPPGEIVEGRVSVFAEGSSPGDSLRVEILADGVAIETLVLPAPAPGETAAASFSLPARPDTGIVRVTAEASLAGDEFPIDDVRPVWLRVGDPVGGVLLVSLGPDWEPRYLLPVLEAVTGLEGEGYLALGTAGFIPLASGDEEVGLVGADRFRSRVANARLLVLHGAGAGIPPWLADLVRGHPRVLHLPAGPEGAALAGVASGEPSEGEWAPASDPPPSPVAPFLTGLRLGGLPPLTSLLGVGGGAAAPAGVAIAPGAGQPALVGRSLRGGADVPLLLLREEEAGRRAVALAQGFWRWGSRDGEARQAYRSLWGGVASWLLDRPESSQAEGIRPAELVQERGVPLRWTVPPGASGSELRLIATDTARVLYRETLVPDPDGIASTASVEPGIYGYEVRDPDSGALFTSGRMEVESWAPSLRYPPLPGASGGVPASEAAGRSARGEGRPLRTHPLPYLLLLALLSVEWLGRRRVGLR